MDDPTEHIIFYDGYCNLCNSSLQFIIKQDKKKVFRYKPLQSKEAEILLSKTFTDNRSFDSVILLEKGKVYTKSEAIYKILPQLGNRYKLLLVFKIFPFWLTDKIYDWIAHNRYKWFGKTDQCKSY